jgi:hypothetical protein
MADEKIATSDPQADRRHDTKGTILDDPEIATAKHVDIDGDDLRKDHMDYGRVDKEVAKYASAVAIDISPEENSRLKKLVDRRVLSIMVFTYFLQALDKGTLSFASIMGIKKDTNLVGQQVRSWRTVFTQWLIASSLPGSQPVSISPS